MAWASEVPWAAALRSTGAATSSIRERSHDAEHSRSRTEVRASSHAVPAPLTPGAYDVQGDRPDPAQRADPGLRAGDGGPEEARRVRAHDQHRPARDRCVRGSD